MEGRKGMKKQFNYISAIVLLVCMLILPLNLWAADIGEDIWTDGTGQVEEIVSSAKKWGVTNDEKLPKVDGVSIRVRIPELIAAGILEDDKILDPRNDKEMTSSCVRIRYHESTNEYKYTFEETCVIDPPRFIDFESIFAVVPRSGGTYIASNVEFSNWEEVVISESENLTFIFQAKSYDTGEFSNLVANSTTQVFDDANSIELIKYSEEVRVTVTDELGQSDYIDLPIRREGCFVAGTKVLTANGYKNIELFLRNSII